MIDELMASLENLLANGKRNQTDDLEEYVAHAIENNRLVAEIVALSKHNKANIAARAIWIVRKLSETSAELLSKYKPILLNDLTQSPFWEVKAELCHIIPRLKLDFEEIKEAIAFFKNNLDDESKIVKAWSLDALYELSKIEAKIGPEVLKLLNIALEDEAASVRARARNILKKVDAKKS